MNNAIQHAKVLKYGLLGITLATAAYITQSNSFSSNAATLATNDEVVQVKRLDASTVSRHNLWSDYEAVFLEQERAISQTFTEIATVNVEIDKLVAAIDQDIPNYLTLDTTPDSTPASMQLGFAASHQ